MNDFDAFIETINPLEQGLKRSFNLFFAILFAWD